MRDAVVVEPDAWCAWCGDPLLEPEDRTWHQRFCCKACKDQWHNDLQKERRRADRERRSCRQCGVEFVALPRTRLFCGRACQIHWHNAKAKAKRMGRAAPGQALPLAPATGRVR